MLLKYNLPAILWALLILILCGIPGKDLPDLTLFENLSFDKIFHLILFIIFIFLLIRGFKNLPGDLFFRKYALITAFFIAVAYGALTEILQSTVFVDRKGNIFDFFANFTGSLIGLALFNFLNISYEKILNRNEHFNEIVFENRFKDYGAYRIRKKYNQTMSISIIIIVVLCVGFFINLMIKGFIRENLTEMNDNIIISELLDLPPPEKNSLPIPPAPPPSEIKSDNLFEKLKINTPVITNDSVDYNDSLNQTKTKILVLDNDSLHGQNNSNNTLSGDGSDVYVIVDEFPKYPGGDEARIKFLQENVKYPKVAVYNGIKGIVYITFIVEKDGTMSNIKLLQGIGGGCDEEALRVAKLMPKWVPGKRKGQPVRVYLNMPIRFFASAS